VMTFLYDAIFYTLAAIILLSTLMAITRSNQVHAVVYLVLSFFGTAVLFYLLGAPLLAALEVIIYAGAIMVLFLFIIMTVRTEEPPARDNGSRAEDEASDGEASVPRQPSSLITHYSLHFRQWAVPCLLGTICLAAAIVVIVSAPDARLQLMPAMATPVEFGSFLFKSYWLPVEVVSFLLFVALVGALYLGKRESKSSVDQNEGNL
jgi:NADH-quinone oxidoreductase subunit J